jgi:hypothetical protein
LDLLNEQDCEQRKTEFGKSHAGGHEESRNRNNDWSNNRHELT